MDQGVAARVALLPFVTCPLQRIPAFGTASHEKEILALPFCVRVECGHGCKDDLGWKSDLDLDDGALQWRQINSLDSCRADGIGGIILSDRAPCTNRGRIGNCESRRSPRLWRRLPILRFRLSLHSSSDFLLTTLASRSGSLRSCRSEKKCGKGFDPYYMLFQLLPEQLVRRINTLPPQAIELDVVVAHHPEYSGSIHRAFEAFRRDSKHPERLRSLEVKSVRHVPALQAADLIAYETLKYQTNVLIENGDRPTRWPMQQIGRTKRYLIAHANVDQVRTE